MARPSPETIVDIILSRRQVYGLDVDSHIREAANRLTARVLFEVLARMDDQSANFGSKLSRLLAEVVGEEVFSLIGFSDQEPVEEAEPDVVPQPEDATEFFLRLVFRNEDAAYYQFPLFLIWKLTMFFPRLESAQEQCSIFNSSFRAPRLCSHSLSHVAAIHIFCVSRNQPLRNSSVRHPMPYENEFERCNCSSLVSLIH